MASAAAYHEPAPDSAARALETGTTASEAPPPPLDGGVGPEPPGAAASVGRRFEAAMVSRDSRLLKESWARLEPIADKVVSHFYALLFLRHPEIRNLFPVAMDTQRDRFSRALLRIVTAVERPDVLADHLCQLARDHRKFGVQAAHYAAVGASLIDALRRFGGDAWTAEVDAAWLAAYGRVSRLMIEAEQDAQNSPPWWHAQVVGHEMRARDIAVITVRPEPPYPYRAGQYAYVETSRWPRVWRPYSIARAPRDDGLLSFHVRAVGAGWVSSALVYRTQPGDVIRLGPPMGTMVLEPESRSDLVLAAGGTGLAPIKAIMEELARTDRSRFVHLFFGARREEELYDLPDLLRLAGEHGRVILVTAVSHDPGYRGTRGMLPDVMARHQIWDGCDVYASGSPAMIRATLSRLSQLGVPFARVRYDAYGQL